MIDFEAISKIFSNLLDNKSTDFNTGNKLENLIVLIMQVNRDLWHLEDEARMVDLGEAHISKTKQKIDKTNQKRNDLIRELDIEVANIMEVYPGPQEKFYSESPGIIIDRLAIVFIKLSAIQGLLDVIQEEDLKKEYGEKKDVVLSQINRLGNFLDMYFSKLANKDVFFEVQDSVKIYNDDRVKKYIKIINKNLRKIQPRQRRL